MGQRKGSEELTIDMTEFNSMMTTLARDTKVPLKKVMMHEAEKVLEQSAKKTAQSSEPKLNKRFTLQGNLNEWAPITKENNPNGKWKGKDIPQYGPKQRPEFVRRILLIGQQIDTRKIEQKDVARIKKALINRRDKKKKNIGASRAVFVAIGKDLGIKVNSTQRAEQAVSNLPDWRKINKGTLKEAQGEGNSVSITLFSSANCVSTLGAKGRFALANAMTGRIKFFRINIAKGVFDKWETAGEKYGFLTERTG
jgi:hypothetical protein